MRLSPSSQLVLGVLVVTFLILAVVGAQRPSPAASQPPNVAVATNGDSSTGSNQPTLASSTPGSEQTGDASPSVPGATATPVKTPHPTPRPTSTTCRPTDQDRYVYNPSRLEVLAACLRVTGRVEAVRHEADGDLHILLALDPAYRHL